MSDVQRSAVLSEDGLYRYRLDRWWGDGPRVAWIMLNPSTADADIDDPTIRRCIGFSKAWGYDGLTVVNLWPFRSPSVAALKAWLQSPDAQTLAHITNLNTSRDVVSLAPLVVAAWGVHGAYLPPSSGLQPRDGPGAAKAGWCQRRGIPLAHLGLTKQGAPRHPLYVKGDTKPIPWADAGAKNPSADEEAR